MSKILIIEDDPYVLRFYENVFRVSNNNHQILTANSGELGITLAKNELPDLILLDIIMPGKSGLDVLAELKKDQNTIHIPIIMLTNINDTETIKKSTELGATGFLIKSDTEPQQLVAKIEEYLAIVGL